MAGQHPFWLLLIGLVLVGVLVWLNLMLARRFRRYVNAGIAVAASSCWSRRWSQPIAAWRGDNRTTGCSTKSCRMAIDQSAARTAGNDAKAYESLRLIKRGSGATYEPLWAAAAAIVEDRADGRVSTSGEAYADGHQQIATLDDDDLWFEAKDDRRSTKVRSRPPRTSTSSTPRRRRSRARTATRRPTSCEPVARWR